jgi:uncharacterized delta-60 repeat protein
VTAFCALAASPAAATPGDYDFSFGGTGFVPNRFGDNSDIDTARDVAGQSDGKVVVVGTPSVADQFAWVVARYTVGGALDPTFGQGGVVRDTVVDDGSIPWAVAIQPDGKIVVGGASVVGAAARFAFVRYLPDGSLDPSFDGDGKTSVAVNPADNQERVQGLAIAPDGKIVGVGKTNDGVGVVRLNSNGSPDSTFDGDGSKDLAMANANTDDVAVQPDGNVVIPVETGAGAGDHFTIIRLDSQGVPDSGFGTAGTVPLTVGTAARSTTAAIQPDGKIVVGGYAQVGSGQAEFAIARLNQNGTPDMSFDGDGQEMTQVGAFESNGQSVLIQPNGKIVLAGVARYDMSGNATVAYARYNTDGSPDSSFLGGGVLLGALPAGWVEAFPSKSAFACDGKILTVGRADLGAPHEQFFTARLLGDPIPCPGLNPPTTAPAGKDRTKPHSRIRGLRRVMLASKLKRFQGTASDNAGIRKVEIALLRRAGKLKAAKARCVWLRSNRATFKRVKPRRGKCAKPRFLRAKGTKKWVFKLRKQLPPGKYILYARATDTSGNRETSFTAKRGNRRAFRVRAD